MEEHLLTQHQRVGHGGVHKVVGKGVKALSETLSLDDSDLTLVQNVQETLRSLVCLAVSG